MYSFTSFLLTVLLFVLLFFIQKLKELSQYKKTYKYVSWIGSKQLDYYFEYAQNSLKLQQEYCIDKDTELESLVYILNCFQEEIIEKYFRDYNSIAIPKHKKELNEETFFMFLLFRFLVERKDDYFFFDKNMSVKVDSKYHDSKLNEFGVVLYKAVYISYMYCKNSEVLKHNNDICNKSWLEEHLQSSIKYKLI